MIYTPDEIRALADWLDPDKWTNVGPTVRAQTAAILREMAEQKPVATVTGCAEVDEQGIPLYARDLDWNQSDIESLPVGTHLYAAPVSAIPAVPQEPTPNLPPVPPHGWLEEARMLAAQCWCDQETSGIEIESRLVEAFAKRLAGWMEEASRYAQNADYWRSRAEAKR
jgi:hypothetical protein